MICGFLSARTIAAGTAATLALLISSASLAAAPGKPPPQGVPQPKILVIDRKAILEGSAVGKSIVQQAQTMWQQMTAQLKGEQSALAAQHQALLQQLAILSADVKSKKERDEAAKESAFQQKVQDKRALLQGGVVQAQAQMEGALGPILKGIMLERGANMLLDRNAVIMSTVDVDITQIVIQRLNQKMPTVKVNLVPLPPGARRQQDQQQ